VNSDIYSSDMNKYNIYNNNTETSLTRPTT